MAVSFHPPHAPESCTRDCYRLDGIPKRAYRDAYAADRAAYVAERTFGTPMRAYRCEAGHWHVARRRWFKEAP